jgi:hypothetical protein
VHDVFYGVVKKESIVDFVLYHPLRSKARSPQRKAKYFFLFFVIFVKDSEAGPLW